MQILPFNERLLTITDLEWTYLAGIIDGEGTLGVYYRDRQHKGPRQITPTISYRCRMTVVNTDVRLIAFIYEKFGGRVDTKKKYNETWKQVYVWELNNVKDMRYICTKIVPHLIVKKRQAEIILEFPYDVRCNQYTPGLTAKITNLKIGLHEETLRLNKRGA